MLVRVINPGNDYAHIIGATLNDISADFVLYESEYTRIMMEATQTLDVYEYWSKQQRTLLHSQYAKQEHGAYSDFLRSAQFQLTDLQDRKTQDGKVQHQMRQDGPEEEFGVVDVASGVGDRLIPESLHGNAIYVAI